MIINKLSAYSKWKQRWFARAKDYSTWSKDPSTKLGAVAVDPINNRELSGGYNGFPRGIADSLDRLSHRETKYKYVVHAEMNCIYNATYNGICLQGSHLYVYGLPVCSECAKGVIQVGITHVFACVPPNSSVSYDKWVKSGEEATEMMTEAGIVVMLFED